MADSGPKATVKETLGKIMRRLMTYAGPAGPDQRLKKLQKEVRALREIAGLHADSIRNLTALSNGYMLSAGLGPKISVIIPVHNRARFVLAAVESVLEQKGADFELLVVNDGSDDEFSQSLAPYISHPALHILRMDRGGAAAARNRGVAASRGDVVVYLDSDNIMFPGYLNALSAAYAANPEARCAHAAMLWDDHASHVHLRHDKFDWRNLSKLTINLDLNCFSHRRELFDALGGFDEALTRHSDYDLVLRYTQNHMPLRINAVAAHYRHSNDYVRITNTQPSAPNIARISAKYRRESNLPLRVLYYLDEFPQLSESYIDTEIEWLKRRGLEIEVFAERQPGSRGVETVPVHRVDSEAVVRHFSPDIIHCHWLHIAAGVAAVAEELKIPVTVRGHGFEFSDATLTRCASLPAVRSIYLFPHFRETLPGDHSKLHAVPACFNTKRYYPRVERDRRLVFRAGACLPTKDLEMFIRVAALCPEYRFLLVLARVKSWPALPGELCALNASLGNPADIRFDVQYDEIAEMTAKAGIYLHTFGFQQPFGMPVSVIESLACGAVVIERDCPEARSYAGPNSLYYTTAAEAAALLREMTTWDEREWTRRSSANAEKAYTHYADEVVLPLILEDWKQMLGLRSEEILS